MRDKRKRFQRTDNLLKFIYQLEKTSGNHNRSIKKKNGGIYRLDLLVSGKIKTIDIDNFKLVIENHREFIHDIDYLVLSMNCQNREPWFDIVKEYIRDIDNIVKIFKDCLRLIRYEDLVLLENGKLKHYVEVK